MPGISSPPPASITRVAAVAILRTSALVPTAVMRDPVIATASAHGCPASPVNTRALVMTMAGAGAWARSPAVARSTARPNLIGAHHSRGRIIPADKEHPMHRFRTTLVAMSILAAVTAAYAQAPAKSAAKPKGQPAPPPAAHVMVNAADLKWGPPPPALPAGSQITVLEGDPGKAAPFVLRAKMPDGYKIMPHWHPTDEYVTVLSGTLVAGMGEKWDDAAMKTFTAGGFAKMPKKTAHYVTAKGETIIQVHAMGPFVVTYVNPKDDPRKKTN